MANLPISEATKIEVTVNGGHLDGRTEYVPIKKRRFVYQSHSPPPPPTTNPLRSIKINIPDKPECHSGQESLTCHNVALGQTVEANIDVIMKKVDNENNHMHVNEDFSGISILANAACSIDLGQEEEFPWDLNNVGADQQEYEDLDCGTDAISRSPALCNVSDKMENNKAKGSPHPLEPCIAILSEVAMDLVDNQVGTSGHDITDIIIPPNNPASLAGNQVRETFELTTNYDSEYEDGELKESIEHTWNEYDIRYDVAKHVRPELGDAKRSGANAFSRPLLPKSCKRTNLKTRGSIGRREFEDKVFEPRSIRKEFQSHVNNSTNKGLWLREFRVQGSRFNDFNESESRHARDQNAQKSVGPNNAPTDHKWRQSRNSIDRPIKRFRSPSGSPFSPRRSYTRPYRGRFDDRDSDHPCHLVARERSFSPADIRIDFHSNRPYRRNPVISHDIRSGDRSSNLRTPHINGRFSQRSERRFPTRPISSDEAHGVSESPQRVNQSIYYKHRHRERYSQGDEDGNYGQQHGYQNKFDPDIRRRNSDEDFDIIGYVDRDNFSGAARRHKELQNSFFHRRNQEFYANSK